MKALFFCLLLVAGLHTSQAQLEVSWACKLISTNDSAKNAYNGPYYALGGPDNILNPFYNFNDSWIPGLRYSLKNGKYDYSEQGGVLHAEFEFCEALVPKQLLIFETAAPGTITKIELTDTENKVYPVYHADAQNMLGQQGRMFTLALKNISSKIKRIKILCEPSKVPGFSGIKAIGISSTDKTYNPNASLPPGELFSGMREGLKLTVDSAYDYTSAEITSDNKHMYLTCHKNKDNTDLYEANGQGMVWEKFKPVGKPINNEKYNHPAGIMPCNNTLYMVNRYNPDGTYLDGAVSVSYKTKNGWSHPENLIIEDWSNNHIYESYTVSYDNKFIVGQFGHKKCYGEGDLYAMIRKEDGTYGAPINLGPVINTANDEANPYLASDGRTLFFASSGHPGYGSMDVFMSVRLDDTWTNWSTPINLGYRINTAGSELSFKMSADGTYAYGYYGNPVSGQMEIYRINLSANSIIKPKPVHFFCGAVFEGKTGKEMVARVRIQNLDTGETEADFTTNKYNGAFQLMMEDKPGKYAIFAEAKGYVSVRKEYTIAKNNRYTEHKVDILLFPLELNAKVTMNTVYFKQSTAELMPQSTSELNGIVEIMNKNPKMKIEIRGHTDNIGNPKDNYLLSLDRANAVKTFLIQQGIDASRITTKGFGGTMPVNSNKTEEDRLQNRRVEFLVTQF
ncbi:MAG: OmpA family protein [Cytophagaceae bacterium]|jgi:outer membrane protein OmpA-like peptidoglycan-associated protein|nr:OmpA family protein [Cytophagaceae bacterium]